MAIRSATTTTTQTTSECVTASASASASTSTSTKYAMRVAFKGSNTWPKENTRNCLNKQNAHEARPKTAFQF